METCLSQGCFYSMRLLYSARDANQHNPYQHLVVAYCTGYSGLVVLI